jgi:hypothetical protein
LVLDLRDDSDLLSLLSENVTNLANSGGVADEGGEDHVDVL